MSNQSIVNMLSKPSGKVTCDGCGKRYVYESSPMIRDDLWDKITNDHWEGDNWVSELLCLDCMEARLGRKITEHDLGVHYRDSIHDLLFLKWFYNGGKNDEHVH